MLFSGRWKPPPLVSTTTTTTSTTTSSFCHERTHTTATRSYGGGDSGWGVGRLLSSLLLSLSLSQPLSIQDLNSPPGGMVFVVVVVAFSYLSLSLSLGLSLSLCTWVTLFPTTPLVSTTTTTSSTTTSSLATREPTPPQLALFWG